MNKRTRVSKVQAGLSAKQLALMSIRRCLRHPSVSQAGETECRKWFAEPTLCEQVEQSVQSRMPKLDARAVNQAVRSAQREALFLAKLFTECNLALERSLREWELEVMLLRVIGSMCAKEERAGAKHPKARHAILTTRNDLILMFQSHLEAVKLLGSEFYDGLDILCSGTREAVQSFLRDLSGVGGASGCLRTHAVAGIAQEARRIARRWIKLVKVQIHQDMGEPSRAGALLIELIEEERGSAEDDERGCDGRTDSAGDGESSNPDAKPLTVS